MNLPNARRYTRYEKLITFIVLTFLIVHAFLPQFITMDKYTMMLLGILLLIAVLPSIYSAKVPYLLEFKRKLIKEEKSKPAEDKMTIKDKSE